MKLLSVLLLDVILLVLVAYLLFRPCTVIPIIHTDSVVSSSSWTKTTISDGKFIYFSSETDPKHSLGEQYNYIYTDFGVFAYDPKALSFNDFVRYIYNPLCEEMNKNKNNLSTPYRNTFLYKY